MPLFVRAVFATLLVALLAAASLWSSSAQAATSESTMRARENRVDHVSVADREEARRARLAATARPADPALASIPTPDLWAQLKAPTLAERRAAAFELLRRDATLATPWLGLAADALATQPKEREARRKNERLRMDAAVNAVLSPPDERIDMRAEAQGVLALALQERGDHRAAIRGLRRSLALARSEERRVRLATLVENHGFRVVGNNVDADVARPRACFSFSDPLGDTVTASGRAADWVRIEGPGDHAVTAKDQAVCVDGLSHGTRYTITLRAGLPSRDGERLARDVVNAFFVRDRKPDARFSGTAYVLPAGSDATIPVTTINTDEVKVAVHRIDERTLVELQNDGTLLSGLSAYKVDQIADRFGSRVFEGSVAVEERTNREVVTAVPVAAITDGLAPGLHVLTAMPDNADPNAYKRATQWFVVSDIGLMSFAASDGFHVIARSLGTAEPLADVRIALVARNNRELATVTTDDKGHARLPAGLLRGMGGDAPALLTAKRDDDFVFLSMRDAGFDLSDRGVAGRAPAGPVDVFLSSERGIYRPGETVHLTGTVRDARARAVEGLRLTGTITRPDGVEHARRLIEAGGAGGFSWSAPLPEGAARGRWTVSVFADPKRPALATARVRVADFEPERIDFDLETEATAFDPEVDANVRLAVRYLFGAPGSDLSIEGEAVVSASRSLPAHPGYLFGLAEEEVSPASASLPSAKTDAEGRAGVALPAIDLPRTTRPLRAAVAVRVSDTNGRPVERRLELPVADKGLRLGLKPRFEDAVAEGQGAGFDIVALADGKAVPATVSWQLERIRTNFQWYKVDGAWNYEPVRSRERVATGEVLVKPGEASGFTTPVEWGEYALTISAPGMKPASHVFNAGWYVAAKGVETPDIARITLDKPRYSVGDTARVFIEPRFAGIADVLVMDERVVSRMSAAIPAEGGTVELPVTAEWGPGAYITAVIVRPMDLATKTMPGRAVALAHAKVDPGSAALDVSLDVPDRIAPRSKLDVGVAIAGLQAGDTAFVTVAMVDEGVLNVTGFEPPSLSDHYFGQRRLGVAIRDVYSNLIDRMAGAPGSVRSGGDGSDGGDFSAPPIEEVVARFSGLVEVGRDGKATVTFDVPDFNGSLRIDALAWSQTGVGEASAKVVARDPVVVSVNKPRFLQPGDTAEISIQATNVELGAMGGEAVEIALVAPSDRIVPSGDTMFSLSMPQGERRSVSVPLRAVAVGEARFGLEVTLPDGQRIVKAFSIPVRSNAPETVRTSSIRLAPGGQLSLTSALFDDLVPGTANATLSVTGVGKVDVAGLVRALDDYPYRCTEQRTSRAFPLVSLPREAVSAALKGREGDVDARVREAITGVLANQSYSGSFGLWRAGSESLWLDAYVTDFLTRAKENGHAVPEAALTSALDGLQNQLQYLSDGADRDPAAYASYVLARNGRAAIGDLRYMAEARKNKLSPLGRAHLAAALGLYGDARAKPMMRAVLAQAERAASWGGSRDRGGFGSVLRDRAAIVAVSLEAGLADESWRDLLQAATEAHRERSHTSTQEDAWTLLAAGAALDRAPPKLSVAGQAHEGPLVTTFDAATLATGTAVRNEGDRTTSAEVTVRGVPRFAPPASANGYRVLRRFYSLDGQPADPATIRRGARLVAVLEVVPFGQANARVVVDDPLPAGFEIDDPNLLSGGAVPAFAAFELLTETEHTEFRADRFIAAFDKGKGDVAIRRFAYVVRAVTPGSFVHPAATAVDMYAPENRGRTAQTRVVVAR